VMPKDVVHCQSLVAYVIKPQSMESIDNSLSVSRTFL
jgi:hypothetical protein